MCNVLLSQASTFAISMENFLWIFSKTTAQSSSSRCWNLKHSFFMLDLHVFKSYSTFLQRHFLRSRVENLLNFTTASCIVPVVSTNKHSGIFHARNNMCLLLCLLTNLPCCSRLLGINFRVKTNPSWHEKIRKIKVLKSFQGSREWSRQEHS